eukprot:TRINITY_DN626_c0_g1_i4.p1 TRINITY_DN626_c0_g1~~TRINITY_DN626_c0_g1_i4.p1  ORF type:complete len:2147 (+),score=1030.76 TRINITY_DN626_c0_g1_i4:75-6515(+)
MSMRGPMIKMNGTLPRKPKLMRGGSIDDLRKSLKAEATRFDKGMADSLSLKWEEFAASIPKKKKGQSVIKEMTSKNTEMSKAGNQIVQALQKLNKDEKEKRDEKEREEKEKLATETEPKEGGSIPEPPAAPAPPPPPLKDKINPFHYAGADDDYYEMFGWCEDPGLYIWMIQNKLPEPVEKSEYGVFYTKDSYIVLNIQSEDTMDKSKKGVHIHTWMGKETTTDKSAVAALRSVELNKLLGDRGILHREDENEESDVFASHFPYGFARVEGGTESTFRNYSKIPITTSHLSHYDPPRLYCLEWEDSHNHASNAVNMVLCEPYIESLSTNQAFILDTGEKLFAWKGEGAENILGFYAFNIVNEINTTERNMEALCIDMSTMKETIRTEDLEEFFSLLGGKLGDKIADEPDFPVPDYVLIKTGTDPETKKLALTPVGEPSKTKPTKKDLDTHHCFVLDAISEIFVWTGKKAKAEEKKIAKLVGEGLIRKDERPDWVIVHNVLEGAERVNFKMKFRDWPDEKVTIHLSQGLNKDKGKKRLAPEKKREVDVRELMDPSTCPKLIPNFEDGDIEGTDGNFEFWVLDKMIGPTFLKLEAEDRGHFWSGDAFMIIYTFNNEDDDQQNYRCYFWEGQDASSKWFATWGSGWFPQLEKKIQESGGKAPQKERIFQREESPNVMSLFNRCIVIHKGRRRDFFGKKNREKTALYHVREFNNGIRAIQVENDPSLLDSSDCFVLRRPCVGEESKPSFLWIGSLFTNREKLAQIQKHFSSVLPDKKDSKGFLIVEEGSEPEEFWTDLGGKLPHLGTNFHVEYSNPPRLFVCSTKSGDFTVKEILEFNQNSLKSDEIFFLDTFKEIYVWIGPGSSETERKSGAETIEKYSNAVSEERKFKVEVQNVTDLPLEPREFTRHFHAWNVKENALDPRARSLLRFQEQKRIEELEEAERQRKAALEEEAKRKEEESNATSSSQQQEAERQLVEEKNAEKVDQNPQEDSTSPSIEEEKIKNLNQELEEIETQKAKETKTVEEEKPKEEENLPKEEEDLKKELEDSNIDQSKLSQEEVNREEEKSVESPTTEKETTVQSEETPQESKINGEVEETTAVSEEKPLVQEVKKEEPLSKSAKKRNRKLQREKEEKERLRIELEEQKKEEGVAGQSESLQNEEKKTQGEPDQIKEDNGNESKEDQKIDNVIVEDKAIEEEKSIQENDSENFTEKTVSSEETSLNEEVKGEELSSIDQEKVVDSEEEPIHEENKQVEAASEEKSIESQEEKKETLVESLSAVTEDALKRAEEYSEFAKQSAVEAVDLVSDLANQAKEVIASAVNVAAEAATNAYHTTVEVVSHVNEEVVEEKKEIEELEESNFVLLEPSKEEEEKVEDKSDQVEVRIEEAKEENKAEESNEEVPVPSSPKYLSPAKRRNSRSKRVTPKLPPKSPSLLSPPTSPLMNLGREQKKLVEPSKEKVEEVPKEIVQEKKEEEKDDTEPVEKKEEIKPEEKALPLKKRRNRKQNLPQLSSELSPPSQPQVPVEPLETTEEPQEKNVLESRHEPDSVTFVEEFTTHNSEEEEDLNISKKAADILVEDVNVEDAKEEEVVTLFVPEDDEYKKQLYEEFLQLEEEEMLERLEEGHESPRIEPAREHKEEVKVEDTEKKEEDSNVSVQNETKEEKEIEPEPLKDSVTQVAPPAPTVSTAPTTTTSPSSSRKKKNRKKGKNANSVVSPSSTSPTVVELLPTQVEEEEKPVEIQEEPLENSVPEPIQTEAKEEVKEEEKKEETQITEEKVEEKPTESVENQEKQIESQVTPSTPPTSKKKVVVRRKKGGAKNSNPSSPDVSSRLEPVESPSELPLAVKDENPTDKEVLSNEEKESEVTKEEDTQQAIAEVHNEDSNGKNEATPEKTEEEKKEELTEVEEEKEQKEKEDDKEVDEEAKNAISQKQLEAFQALVAKKESSGTPDTKVKRQVRRKKKNANPASSQESASPPQPTETNVKEEAEEKEETKVESIEKKESKQENEEVVPETPIENVNPISSEETTKEPEVNKLEDPLPSKVLSPTARRRIKKKQASSSNLLAEIAISKAAQEEQKNETVPEQNEEKKEENPSDSVVEPKQESSVEKTEVKIDEEEKKEEKPAQVEQPSSPRVNVKQSSAPKKKKGKGRR